MKHVIRYLLEGDGTVPVFVQDGGYFFKNEELVGISVNDTARHLPQSVIKLTRDDLILRILEVAKNIDGSDLTEEEAEQMADSFLEKLNQ